MKMSQKTLFLAGLVALLGVNKATAACTDPATPGEWTCLEVEDTANPGSYIDETNNGQIGPFTFSGTSALNIGGFLSATCELSVTGFVEVATSPDRAFIRMVSGSISGADPTCGRLNLANFDWHAHDTTDGAMGIAGASNANPPWDPVPGEVRTISVTHNWFGPICNGDMGGLNFVNDPNQSYFSFNGTIPGSFGTCSVIGDLEAPLGENVRAW